jgi:hypothetical protein
MTGMSPIGARQRWTRYGREVARTGQVGDPRSTDELRRAFDAACRADPGLANAAETVGTVQAFARFCGGVWRGLGIDLRRRPDVWSHELVVVTMRMPSSLRDRFDRVPGRRREDRLRRLVEVWEEQLAREAEPAPQTGAATLSLLADSKNPMG